jgi:hypothetical protein
MRTKEVKSVLLQELESYGMKLKEYKEDKTTLEYYKGRHDTVVFVLEILFPGEYEYLKYTYDPEFKDLE